MSRFRLFILFAFCAAILALLTGCGTIKGIGNDLSVVGEILSNA